MNKKDNQVSKVLIVGGALAAVGGAVYFASKAILKKKEESQAEDIDVNINVNQDASPVKKLPSRNDNFPLKFGSLGERVRALQEAIKRIIGEKAMSQFTKVDGDFRSGTESSLRAAKLPTVIDEATFNKLVGNNSSISISPATVGSKLYFYASQKNFDGVMSMLKTLKNVSDYSEANKAFISQQLFSVSKSIVTYLLDTAFKYNIEAKAAIRSEFLRIGLKSTASDPINEDGKWSLSGFGKYRDLITITATYAVNKKGNKIPVERNTILGEEIGIKNGMTFFRSIDREEFSVPTAHIKYD